jgi:hypothetical protein
MSEPSLPSVYAGWLREAAGGPLPPETKATCHACVMLPAADSPPQALHFHPSTRCCTYQPNLPNFLVGAILADSAISDHGRAALDQRLAARVAVTPSGVLAGALFALLYHNVANVFGRASALRCGYLDPAGGCGIWAHRPGVCATWFCKHDRGETGFRFWSLADKLLRGVEQDLALWCMTELHAELGVIGEEAPARGEMVDVAELEQQVDEGRYQRLWGTWAGRERQFYGECARLVGTLSWSDVGAICGPRVRALASLLRDASEHLHETALPERVRVNTFQSCAPAPGGFTVVAYSRYDPLFMSDRLMHVLSQFDGRATEDALAAIQRDHGLRVAPALVRRLIDFGILTPATDTPGA